MERLIFYKGRRVYVYDEEEEAVKTAKIMNDVATSFKYKPDSAVINGIQRWLVAVYDENDNFLWFF